jgi:hypothetical protein
MSRTCVWPATAAIRVGVCLLSIALPSALARAQQATDASSELISAILRHAYRYEGGNVRVLNGRVPEDLATFYVPPGTRILGTVVAGSSVRVFARSTSPPDSLRELYARALAPAGWKPFSRGNSGGFVDARRDTPIVFCRDGAQLQIQRHTGAAGMHDLVLDYRDGMGPCSQPMGTATGTVTGTAMATASASTVRGFMLESTRPRLPTLYSPDDANASARSRCFPQGGQYGGTVGTGTVISSTGTAAELLRHYAAQLEGAGWRTSTTGGRQAAIGTWTLADTSGVRQLTLQVTESSRTAAGCFDVQMRMSELPR